LNSIGNLGVGVEKSDRRSDSRFWITKTGLRARGGNTESKRVWASKKVQRSTKGWDLR
jgi:hypothetical protein